LCEADLHSGLRMRRGGRGGAPVLVNFLIALLDDVFVKPDQAGGKERGDQGQNHFLKKGPVHCRKL